ncbi:MAG TPA: GNAT family N-acetyltransferase, partial [Desulfosalsimonadaceae bacterium]|nr:GNAT family N-acetyltransferase [Desulfosalsimonadaceae bacterium]
KTTLIVEHPDCRRLGIGIKLQTIRIEAMAARGVKKVTTNADLPKTIAWYKKHFGYREVGRLKKLHEFGDPSIYWWTTLEMDLDSWAKNRYSV